MDKVQAIKHLEQAGYSNEESLNSWEYRARRFGTIWAAMAQRIPKRPPVGAHRSDPSKDTKALTGSSAASAKVEKPQSHSRCEPFHELIRSKLEQGLDAMRIHQDLKNDHGFTAQYHSVRRYVAQLGS